MGDWQSSGIGVNSIALAEVIKYKATLVFADTGGELPETYDYLKSYSKLHPVTILNEPIQGFSTLEAYCRFYKTPPMRHFRWCTDKFKTGRLEAYYKSNDDQPHVFLGIAYDERHRIKNYKKGKITYEYPLVDQKITREQCIEIIKNAGLGIPVKSGCYFCPFQRKEKWIELLRNHPELYASAIELDELTSKIRLYDHGLRELKGRVDLGLEQRTLFNKDPDDDWECQFCMIV